MKHKNLLPHIKMDKETITFGNSEIGKHKLHCHKKKFFSEEVCTDDVLVSNKIFFRLKKL